jgi:hypothetical protein
VPSDTRERAEHIETFATTMPSLLALADRLKAHGVNQVVIEATGVYRNAVWAILEDRLSCTLVNARRVKQVAGSLRVAPPRMRRLREAGVQAPGGFDGDRCFAVRSDAVARRPVA